MTPQSARNVRRPVKSAESAPTADLGARARASSGGAAGGSRAVGVLRVIVGILMVIGIGSGVVWAARRYVHTSPRFAIREILTSGGARRSPEAIASTCGIAAGQNIFSVDLDAARRRLTADPWIEAAEVTRQLPQTIAIRVVEREASGVVAMAEGTYLVTRDGVVIKHVEAGDPLDLHVVTGIAPKTLALDREGATRTIRQALDLAFDYERSPLAQRSPLQEVHVEPNGELTLMVGKSGVALRMGAAPYRKKLDQAVRVVAELDRRGAKPETIMLDDEARPDRVVVRMR